MRLSKADHAHTDARGSIFDIELSEEVGAIGHVTFTDGAVRGNHVHEHTTQWNYVVVGRLTVAVVDVDLTRHDLSIAEGDLLRIDSGEQHAFRADAPTQMMVFTMGPRAGKEYESDTIRLEAPLLEER